MTALKAKWDDMTYYQRILLILMLLEIAVFGVITAVSVNRLGIAYGDSLLFPRTEGTLQIYEGEVDGEAACFTVSPDREISYQWGDCLYGPYQILEDPSAVPEPFSGGTGVEIRQGRRFSSGGSISRMTASPSSTRTGRQCGNSPSPPLQAAEMRRSFMWTAKRSPSRRAMHPACPPCSMWPMARRLPTEGAWDSTWSSLYRPF